MKKKYLLAFLCSILFLGIVNVNAIAFNSTDKNIAGTEEDEVIYIIGTHLFSEKTPYLSTQKIMLASQTIKLPENIKEEEALDYMVIYTRDLEGNWIDALDGQSTNIPSTFDIQYTDLKAFDSIVVNSLEELESALDEEGYKTIILGSDIDAGNASIVVDRKVTIDGNGKKLTFGELAKSTSGLVISADNSKVKNLTIEMTEKVEWQGNYALQVFNAKGVVLENYTGTKADAALLVNGSAVELKGVTNVSGNEFGGIEVSRGKDLTENGLLKVTGTITMTDEDSKKPVIWVEKEQGSVNVEGYVSTTDMNDKDQTYYYSDEKYITDAKVDTLEELKSALVKTNIKNIIVVGDITGINETITATREVTIDGKGHKLQFAELARVNGVASGLVVSANNTEVKNLTIEMTEKEKWQGNYALQVFNAKGVVLENYTGTKADAALLVNGSAVELKGVTNVSGNEFGGIEVSRGKNLTDNSVLKVTGTITMTDEATERPVIWIEKEEGTVEVEGYVSVKDTLDKKQTYYYSDEKFITKVEVSTLEELKAALADTKIKEVRITKDITGISETLSANHEIVIDGRKHKLQFNEIAKVNGVASGLVISANNTEVKNLTIEMTEKEKWQGNYALQVFNAKGVVLENYTGTKADAALLVNGSAVELKGVTNVSGNEFGGIEVSRGKNLTDNSVLKVTGTITMTDEAYKVPAVWVVKEQGSVVGGSFTTNETIKADQIQYYLSSTNANE